MVGLDALGELAHVDAHGEEVLPDLPVLVVTLESLLQRSEGLFPVRQTERETERDTERQRERDTERERHRETDIERERERNIKR